MLPKKETVTQINEGDFLAYARSGDAGVDDDVLHSPYVVVGHEEDWLERHGTMNATVND
jgi:hypothetical protein